MDEDAASVVHVITDKQLLWWNPNQSPGDVVFEGADIIVLLPDSQKRTGVLDETGGKLLWNDGKAWTKAGVDGLWKEPSGRHHTIEDFNIMSKPTTQKMVKIGPISYRCTGTDVVVSVDAEGMQLWWSDGDPWMRTRSDGTEYCMISNY